MQLRRDPDVAYLSHRPMLLAKVKRKTGNYMHNSLGMSPMYKEGEKGLLPMN